MRKFHLYLILSVIILFGYQNCENAPYKTTTEVNSSSSVSLANENIQKIYFFAKENTTVQQSSSAYTLVTQNSYGIDFTTGEILKSSDINSTPVRYCLSQSLLTELRNILNSSQVCKTENSHPLGQVCTMVYKSGYAQIVTSRDQIDLGSGSDGCGTNQVDLCQLSSSDMLKGWFAAVKNQLPQLTCP